MRSDSINHMSLVFAVFCALVGSNWGIAGTSSNANHQNEQINQVIIRGIPLEGLNLEQSQWVAWNRLNRSQEQVPADAKEIHARVIIRKAVLVFNQKFTPRGMSRNRVIYELYQELKSIDLSLPQLSDVERRQILLWEADAIAQSHYELPGMTRNEAVGRTYELYEQAQQIRPTEQVRLAQANLVEKEGFHLRELENPRLLGEVIAEDFSGEFHAFEEYQLSGENFDCGFRGLGVTRQAAIQKLLENSSNPVVRSLVAPDIVSAFTIGSSDLPEFEADDRLPLQIRQQPEFLRLQEEFVTAQAELDRQVRVGNKKLRNLTEGKRLDAEGLLAFERSGQSSQLTGLREAKLRVEENQEQIRQFAEREDIFRSYVRHYLGGRIGGSAEGPYSMLTIVIDPQGGQQTSAMDAIAYLFGIHLEILSSSEEDETLKWVHRFDPSTYGIPIQQKIVLRYRADEAHFNQLIPVDRSNAVRKRTRRSDPTPQQRKMKRLRVSQSKEDKTFRVCEGDGVVYTSRQSELMQALLEDPKRLEKAEVQLLEPLHAQDFPLSTWVVYEKDARNPDVVFTRIFKNHPESFPSRTYLMDPKPAHERWRVFLRNRIETSARPKPLPPRDLVETSQANASLKNREIADLIKKKTSVSDLNNFLGTPGDKPSSYLRRNISECYKYGLLTFKDTLYLKNQASAIGGYGATVSKVQKFLEDRSQGLPTKTRKQLADEFNASSYKAEREIASQTFSRHVESLIQKRRVSQQAEDFWARCKDPRQQ